ncbi:hypothetical protein K504DRAFT_417440 [Pleomassaria siparia CBS 279.74]|uniref:Mediator of RNA polymerase II transcription subunit 12 n=1 Tax=Pleomassaria siparia CBS 279.74 TaxID=1314801 RepID=A0A6G1JTK9_9PLEO|nr:hypothetical protein K504DRAFT_417440 [Pleomassaria siparia CBS 279.74]
MTSRPGPGIPESLQHRGNGAPPRGQVRRRPSRPIISNLQYAQQDCIDPTKPAPLDSIHTAPNDAVRPPPRGRPPLFFSGLGNNSFEPPIQSPRAQLLTAAINLPVPPRPGSSIVGDISQQPRILPGGSGVKDDAIAKAPSPDAPMASMLFAGGKTADFFPWTGTPSEDLLNEALVKQGISNKPQIMNETNTARPTLWVNLKNKSGLTQLSTLFVAVLEKRQACGRLTAPNTFKPPPRLTLRDSTREAWLHDLANPTVGLRRLSRTIPHGITGKVLLDQCLNKNIPIPRAMWLAKCVGINEMRSHKRKGQAGTITWVRGWTSSVEQFLDSIVATIGQQDWKPRITYALQLVTHLYKEKLLEEDHFLEWVLKNLEICPTERLFLWLLLVSIFWPNLISSRRRSKRLAEALLNQAEKLYQLEAESQASPVLVFLEETIIRLLVTNPTALLLPMTWDKHGAVLRTLSQRRSHPQISRIVADLEKRNRRLLRPSSDASSTTVDAPGQVYRLLDSLDCSVNVHIDTLSDQCMELISDPKSLISTALAWASSMYRDGVYRTYLVTRLLRKWSLLGFDVDDGILSYLTRMSGHASNELRIVFRIVAELVRSKTFSIGRYLQWLIATGSLGYSSDFSAPSTWPVHLITEIPLNGLPEQVRVLRSTLLRNTVHSAEDEAQALHQVKDKIQRQASRLFGMEIQDEPPPLDNLSNLSSSLQLELGVWLRKQVSLGVEIIERVPTKDPSIEESGAVCRISSHDFHVVRFYMEMFNDLSILADVIGVVSTSLDPDVLASAADTLHYHHQAFNAIGAFEPLFGKIAMRYAAIRTVRFPERDLILSLTDLARTARADAQLLQLLAYDLSRYEQKGSLAACSPASDNMGEVVDTGMDTEDEIDRILSSGTSMDRQIMTRLFGKIVHNLEDQVKKSSHRFENHSIWFYRLRSFDESTFDGILTEWLTLLVTSHQAHLVSAALPPLVASGCLSLHKILEIVQRCTSKKAASNPEDALLISIAGLDMVLPSDHQNRPCQPRDAYRYRLAQRKFCQDPEGRVLGAIYTMVELRSGQLQSAVQAQFTAMLLNKRLLAVVRHFAIHDITLLSTSFGLGIQMASSDLHSYVKSILDNLLDPIHSLDFSHKSFAEQIATVVESANELSLPFCQLEIRHIFSMDAASFDTSAETISSALLQAVKLAVENDQSSWSTLIAGLEADLTSKIREHAERELFSASAFLSVPSAADVDLSGRDDTAIIRKFLTVIDFTATGAPKHGQSFAFGTLVDRLKGLAEVLNKSNDTIIDIKNNNLSISPLWSWLDALLHLAVVHSPVLSNKAGNQQQAALLWSLKILFTHPTLCVAPFIAQYVFDVAVLLSDSVSDEVRNHLAKLDASKFSDDARCTFIFGTISPPDGWLILTKPVTPSATSQSTSSSQPPTQHSNHSQSPQQYQQFPNASPASLQRSLSQQQQQQQQQMMQNQASGRVYPHYPQHAQQHSKMPPQFQRMPTQTQQTQLQQLQQMQQMQGAAQLRASQASPVQRPSAPAPQSSSQTGKVNSAKQEKLEMRPVPFSLRKWEILPESGGNPAGNETAISLSLFGARKV